MNENTVPALAVFRARMPYVDRRALSEAWFSALHVAAREPRRACVRLRALAAEHADPHAAAPPSRTRTAGGARPPAPAAPSRRAGAPARGPADPFERTRPDASRRTACDVAPGASPAAARGDDRARSYPAHRSSLTVGAAGARVQLVMRREGATLHVIALCRAEDAPLVRRALARAHEAIRLRGDSLRATVRAIGAEAAGA